MACNQKEYQKAYQQTHRTQIRTQQKAYKQAHKAQVLASRKRYNQIHKAQVVAFRKQYQQTHRAEMLAYQRVYYKEHSLYHKVRNWNRKLEVIQLLGGKCRKCGLTDVRLLQVNHINGRGRKESAQNLYPKILSGKRTTKDLELLCANCNLLYEYERGKRFSP